MKKIDINNEEQILKDCNIDYLCRSKKCSGELCRFFNDIPIIENADFDKKQALIDLGRIAITLNEQNEKINELQNQIKTSYREGLLQKQFDKDMEIAELKQSQYQNAIEVLEKVKAFCEKYKLYHYGYSVIIVEETREPSLLATLYDFIRLEIAKLGDKIQSIRDKGEK